MPRFFGVSRDQGDTPKVVLTQRMNSPNWQPDGPKFRCPLRQLRPTRAKTTLRSCTKPIPGRRTPGPEFLAHDGEEAGSSPATNSELTVGDMVGLLNSGNGYLFDSPPAAPSFRNHSAIFFGKRGGGGGPHIFLFAPEEIVSALTPLGPLSRRKLKHQKRLPP